MEVNFYGSKMTTSNSVKFRVTISWTLKCGFGTYRKRFHIKGCRYSSRATVEAFFSNNLGPTRSFSQSRAILATLFTYEDHSNNETHWKIKAIINLAEFLAPQAKILRILDTFCGKIHLFDNSLTKFFYFPTFHGEKLNILLKIVKF